MGAAPAVQQQGELLCLKVNICIELPDLNSTKKFTVLDSFPGESNLSSENRALVTVLSHKDYQNS